jgi:hypothetical protein
MMQYMTLSSQSTERIALIPVLAMLLQFSKKELDEIQKALKDPNYGVKLVKEVKRTDFSSLFSFGTTSAASHSARISTMDNNPSSYRSNGSISGAPTTSTTTAASSAGLSEKPPVQHQLPRNDDQALPPVPSLILSPMTRNSPLSMSDQDLHLKLKDIQGDILDISMSHDEIDHRLLLAELDEGEEHCL